MSFWRRLFGQKKTASKPPKAAERESAPASQATPNSVPAATAKAANVEARQLESVAGLGRDDGPEVAEVLSWLRRHQGSRHGNLLLRACCQAVAVPAPHLDPIRAFCAGQLSAQGELQRGLSVLEHAHDCEALMLAAELHAQLGELARAIGMVQRVLARNIDTPGARERNLRWSRQLGLAPATRVSSATPTMVAPEASQSHYRILREVSRGGAGTVYEAEDALLGRRLAYKIFHRGGKDRVHILREARATSALAGRGIVRLLEADPEEGWLASEWIPGGSLRDLLRNERVHEALPLERWFPQLVAILQRIHQRRYVHGDLKPANLLFRSPSAPLICDFGSCQPAGGQHLSGTPGYLSPQRLAGNVASPSDDVYALGRILEDVLNARADQGQPHEPRDAPTHWQTLAHACLKDGPARPRDGTALMELLVQTAPADALSAAAEEGALLAQ